MPGEEEQRVGSSSGAHVLTSNQTKTGTTAAGPRRDKPAEPAQPFKNHHHQEPGGPLGSAPARTAPSPPVADIPGAEAGASSWKDPPGLPPHRPPLLPPPCLLSPLHHAEIEEDDDLALDGVSSDGSKLELELQFAGVDNENVELDEDGSNYPLGEYGSAGGVEGTGEEADDGPAKPPEPAVVLPLTLAQKCLFYTTAFFILLAVFSLFSFLFLVPFVIDPALTTIFNEFDPEPATCFTEAVVNLTGPNCTKSWTSCREGCTKEVYNCTQIWVRYRLNPSTPETTTSLNIKHKPATPHTAKEHSNNNNNYYNYQLSSRQVPDSSDRSSSYVHKKKKHKGAGGGASGELTRAAPQSAGGTSADGWHTNAHLYPNVKGCGYPPSLNCSVFLHKYAQKGQNYSCFYSKVKPWLVVTTFNMDSVVLQLALSMAIPVPCFIISVIYLVFAYFKIYNTDSASSATANPLTSSTNNNIQSPAHDMGGLGSSDPDPDTSLSTMDEKTRIIRRSTSRGLNAVSALTDKLMPNSAKGLHGPGLEMNDLTPMIQTPPDGDLLLPSRNNRAPERNGPTNPAAKNKGGEPTLLGGFEETDF